MSRGKQDVIKQEIARLNANNYISVQFSCSDVSNSLRPDGLQHTRSPCPSPTPEVCSNSCPLVGDAIQPSDPLSSPSPPTFHLSQHQGLLYESVLRIRWLKYWSFSFNISPSSKHSGLIFRVDWLDLLAVQGTLKSLLQYHSSKASILWCSAFFIVQLSHPYRTTGKIYLLTSNNKGQNVCEFTLSVISICFFLFVCLFCCIMWQFPPHWEHRVLSTGLPRKSLYFYKLSN